MTKKFERNKIIFYILMLVLCSGMFSLGLKNLSLEKGNPIPGAVSNQSSQTESDTIDFDVTNDGVANTTFLQAVVSILFLLSVFFIFLAIFRKLSKGTVIKIIIVLSILIIVIFIVSQFPIENRASNPAFVENQTPAEFQAQPVNPINNPPIQIYWIVILGLVMLGIGIIVSVLMYRIHDEPLQDPLARNIDIALDS